MQDIHSMSGAAGRIYGGDRRMRPHPHQALKCPRCDSLNTKFCYYNNYNLSQPRHFCKSCRRYWTKGGVLRNVPVGGGCRKTKRSKPKSTGSDDTSTAANDVTPPRRDRKPATASHSSSESSSLTATAAAGTADGAASVVSSASGPPASAPTSALLNFPESALFQNPIVTSANSSTPFETAATLIDDSAIFSEAGSFTNLMTSSNPSLLGFNFVDMGASGPFRYQQQQKMVGLMEDMKMQELTTGFMDQTVSVELPPLQNRGASGGLTALDWQSNGDQGLFDLAGGVVDQGYWAHSHWADHDQTLYLP